MTPNMKPHPRVCGRKMCKRLRERDANYLLMAQRLKPQFLFGSQKTRQAVNERRDHGADLDFGDGNISCDLDSTLA